MVNIHRASQSLLRRVLRRQYPRPPQGFDGKPLSRSTCEARQHLGTDQGDNEDGEDGPKEWKAGSQDFQDRPGDDAVRVVLTSEGEVEVGYVGPSAV